MANDAKKISVKEKDEKYVKLSYHKTYYAQLSVFQLAVVPTRREYTKTLRSFFSLNRAIDQLLREFYWLF